MGSKSKISKLFAFAILLLLAGLLFEYLNKENKLIKITPPGLEYPQLTPKTDEGVLKILDDEGRLV